MIFMLKGRLTPWFDTQFNIVKPKFLFELRDSETMVLHIKCLYQRPFRQNIQKLQALQSDKQTTHFNTKVCKGTIILLPEPNPLESPLLSAGAFQSVLRLGGEDRLARLSGIDDLGLVTCASRLLAALGVGRSSYLFIR